MIIKNLSDIYWKNAPNIFFVSLVLGISTGFIYATIIPTLMYALSADRGNGSEMAFNDHGYFNSPTENIAILFLCICLSLILIKSISITLSTYAAQNGSKSLRLSLYKKIQNLPYFELEKIGQSKLINLLHIDVPNITNAALHVPLLWINSVTITGILGYLLYLDQSVFLFIIVALIVGIITYQGPMLISFLMFKRSRSTLDTLQANTRSLILGAKELKLDTEKANHFFQKELSTAEHGFFKQEVVARGVLSFTEVYGEMIAFLVIGIVIFQISYSYDLQGQDLASVVMALLYLTGPVGLVLNSINEIQKGKASLANYKNLIGYFQKSEIGISEEKDFTPTSLTLKNIHFRYEENARYIIKGIDYSFNEGVINFIVGGNGSGKSTLSKIMTMHYRPTEGEVYLGSQKVMPSYIQSARNHISAIYTDFHLFTDLYKQYDISDIERLLKLLQLDKIVEVKGNKFTTTKLSDGQKKRLALLVMLLEDRKIMLFDEWAADQDPDFKHTFYRQILPELKLKRKIVIVISHDDSYFDVADHLVQLRDGNIVSSETYEYKENL